jgi:hypothetical protein
VDLPRHLWPAIQARVAAEPPAASRGRLLRWPLSRARVAAWAAAAALVLAAGLGIYSINRSGSHEEPTTDTSGIGPPADVVASVQVELEAAEAHYEKAIQGLEQIAQSERSALDPQVAAVLQKNLQVIDQAIGESRAALQQQPASAHAQDSLFDAMRSKVALLQQTVELINEMRKGNQAEAGRLIQGLNQ